ncbi:hypothetical protein O6B42_02770 [Campylobacter ureolyticus]|uniref:hypothetical protein n=1 Tax=Campylobacter ureolyticus TaxID=827 RepID=UPI0022B2C4AF|nr:hypothetical protein [Campylobacter ureolyticus]MCZ6132807.1 hypothetical protein [Campylobacter ureolyticus]
MEEILYNKHKEIDECKKFIEFIEKYFLNSNKPDSNSNILINLLNQKVKILNSLDYKNCKNLVLSFEKLDDEIYNQIEILKSEINRDFNNVEYINMHNNSSVLKLENQYIFLKKIYKKVYENHQNKDIALSLDYKYNIRILFKIEKNNKIINKNLEEIKQYLLKNNYFEKYIYKKSAKVKKEAFFDIFNFIRAHKWISTFLFFSFGFVIYILFFFFQGYIPAISQNELPYQIIQSSGIFLLIPCLIILFVFWYSSVYINDRQNSSFDNKFLKIFSKSLFVNLTTLLIMLVTSLILEKKLTLEINFINILCFYLCIFIYYLIVCNLILLIIKYRAIQMTFYIFLIFVCMFVAMYISLLMHSSYKLFFIFFIFMSMILFWILFIFNETNKKENYYLMFASFLFMLFGIVVTLSDYIYKTLNISGVEYKYIVLDKKADEFLPDEVIYKFNCDKEVEIISYIDSNLTYKTDNGSKIRNLKDKDCLTFVDDNNKTINTDNKKFTFKDGNLTFIGEENNTIQNVKVSFNNKSCLTYAKYKNDSIFLYNIEAISTLGKYWYIKTKFDDKFELQSDFIKTKVKK